MGFIRRANTSLKVPILDGARKEIEYLFHHEIAAMAERHSILNSMILNIDKTPLKCFRREFYSS